MKLRYLAMAASPLFLQISVEGNTSGETPSPSNTPPIHNSAWASPPPGASHTHTSEWNPPSPRAPAPVSYPPSSVPSSASSPSTPNPFSQINLSTLLSGLSGTSGPITQTQLNTILSELSTALQGGFTSTDLISAGVVLVTNFNELSNLTVAEKQSTAVYVFNQLIAASNMSPFEQTSLEALTPVLAAVLFPDPLTVAITPPTDASPTNQDIINSVSAFLGQTKNALSLEQVPSAILYAQNVASSYISLSPQNQDVVAKEILTQIIASADIPILYSYIFDELCTTIGNPLIDYHFLGTSR